MHGFSEVPDTVVSVDEFFFFFHLVHLVKTPPIIQAACSTFLLVFTLY